MGWCSVGLVGTRGLGSPLCWALSHHIKIRFYHRTYDYQWGEEKRGEKDREFGMMYTQLELKWIANKDCVAHGTLLNVLWQPGWEGSLGEDGYTYTYGWDPVLST